MKKKGVSSYDCMSERESKNTVSSNERERQTEWMRGRGGVLNIYVCERERKRKHAMYCVKYWYTATTLVAWVQNSPPGVSSRPTFLNFIH